MREDEAVGSGCPHSAPLLTWGGANRTKCVSTGLFLGKITNSMGSISSKKSHGTVFSLYMKVTLSFISVWFKSVFSGSILVFMELQNDTLGLGTNLNDVQGFH